MRAFRFRLQALLDRRTLDEQQAEHSAAAAARAHDEASGSLNALRDGIRIRVDELARYGAALSVWERQTFERHLASLESEIARAKALADERAAALEYARVQLRAARRARGIIERLRERARAAFDEQEARLEELELDDVNARRHERAHR